MIFGVSEHASDAHSTTIPSHHHFVLLLKLLSLQLLYFIDLRHFDISFRKFLLLKGYDSLSSQSWLSGPMGFVVEC